MNTRTRRARRSPTPIDLHATFTVGGSRLDLSKAIGGNAVNSKAPVVSGAIAASTG